MDTRTVARKLAEESIILLKNEEHILPFVKGQRTAFFGRAQIDMIYSGNGSGAAHTSGCKNILQACEEAGTCAEPKLKAFYRQQIGAEKTTDSDLFDWSNPKEAVNSGIMYEIFGRYHAPAAEYGIPEKELSEACAYTDTAVLVLGRNSGGEECDRHLRGDYYLTDSERALTGQVCGSFEKVVLILNINGLIDLSWTERYKNIKGILFLGIPGEEGAAALADILVGNVDPSGKLPVTIAKKYEDYPAFAHFSWDKEEPDRILTYDSYGLDAQDNGSVGFEKSPVTVYLEDIYAGYRYFDTFDREPLFPFGYGLSYTDFMLETVEAVKEINGVRVTVNVKNIGRMAGKETVQLYLSAVHSKTERVYQELKGFEKTKLLAAGEQESVSMFIPWKEFACYDEERAAYLIERGEYLLRTGNSSRNTKAVVSVTVEKDIPVEQCRNQLGIKPCNKGKITFLSKADTSRKEEAGQEQCRWKFILQEVPSALDPQKSDKKEQWNKEQCNKGKDLTVEELAALCVGYGPGVPFSAFGDGSDPETICDQSGKPLTTNSHPTGFNGYVSPAIEEKGIYSVFYKDGPAGIGEAAWPSEMLIACAFNRKIWYEFGDAVGEECETQQVDIWLAPAVNLHRHPLGGRNFEYFSEDPYLTGICACEVAKGVQENHPVLVCPKHFAVNEQETYRRGNAKKNYDAADSIIRERAARELYLKPFEMLVKDANIHCIMTSFNKINGVFAGGNADLCTRILREEWGFVGAVVTDWGDMDIVVDGADAVAAGNDIVMPGGPPVIGQILKGYREGRVTRADLELAVSHLLEMEDKKNGQKNV